MGLVLLNPNQVCVFFCGNFAHHYTKQSYHLTQSMSPHTSFILFKLRGINFVSSAMPKHIHQTPALNCRTPASVVLLKYAWFFTCCAFFYYSHSKPPIVSNGVIATVKTTAQIINTIAISFQLVFSILFLLL